MARLPQDGLTEREGQIMNILWQEGKATVERIRDGLEMDLAPSTIRTLLNIMDEKGYVAFHKSGKAKVFRPRVAREAAQASALATLKDRLFQGSTSMLLARLVEDEEVSVEVLEKLRQEVKGRNSGGGKR